MYPRPTKDTSGSALAGYMPTFAGKLGCRQTKKPLTVSWSDMSIITLFALNCNHLLRQVIDNLRNVLVIYLPCAEL